MKQVKKCPFCKKSFRLKGTRKAAGKYVYEICSFCGGAVISPFPTKKEIKLIYSDRNYFKVLSQKTTNPFLNFFLNLKINQQPFEWVEKRFPNKSVLDVGPGNGEFLEYLKNRGRKVFGIDVSLVAAKNINKRIGNVVRVGIFPKLRIKETFDLISFWHVLEHVDDPGSYLSKAYRLLEGKSGIVVGEVPNFDSLAFITFKKNYNWIMVPEHVLYFSPKALRIVLKKAGFKKVEIVPTTRALMNYFLSFRKMLLEIGLNTAFVFPILLFVFWPFVFITFFATFMGKGEVLRFIAYK